MAAQRAAGARRDSQSQSQAPGYELVGSSRRQAPRQGPSRCAGGSTPAAAAAAGTWAPAAAAAMGRRPAGARSAGPSRSHGRGDMLGGGAQHRWSTAGFPRRTP